MTQTIINYLYAIPAVLFAISIHEFSHGYLALKLGDPTAKLSGRLTLNPLKHLDIFGVIAMLLVGVGWANPVPVNSRYFKKPRRDCALVALAGPVSNVLSAFIFSVIYLVFIKYFAYSSSIPLNLLSGIVNILQNFIFLNVGLAVFNMLPVPPLDGSRILDAFLPPRALHWYHKYERVISIVMLVVIITGFISPLIQNGVYYVVNFILKIARFIVKI